jgi:hypothetical protein
MLFQDIPMWDLIKITIALGIIIETFMWSQTPLFSEKKNEYLNNNKKEYKKAINDNKKIFTAIVESQSSKSIIIHKGL